MIESKRWNAARIAALSSMAAVLSGCTAMPEGPSVMVLPGTGKSFDQFRLDDIDCRQYASAQLGGGTAAYNAADSGVHSAALGTLLGAAAGAAANGGRGAGVGAGAGLALGGMAGTGAAQQSGGITQRRYDMGYQQCMYAKGHRIPSYGYGWPTMQQREPVPPAPSSQPSPPKT